MADYKSIVAYDGTGFEGFQRQPDGRRTVQSELESALRGLGWAERSLRAAGRTDAGVHARGQVVAFRLAWEHGPARLTSALNSALPPDVAIRQTERVSDGFHPRYAARSRRYSYTLVADPVRDPLRERRVWRVWPEPDPQKIRLAANALVGRRDFRAFGPALRRNGSTVRRVILAEWTTVEDRIVFTIEADAFLYRMVRRLVSAMVAVGQGKTSLEAFQALLDDPQQRWQRGIAPPQGLCLESVSFEE